MSDSVVEDALIGRVLEDRYRIEALLGQGGVGVVYRAEHTKLRRPVALKVLRPDYRALSELERRFEREAQALAALAHPHIVSITDYGLTRGKGPTDPPELAFLAMELLEGRTLAEMLLEGPPAPVLAADLARQILRGLAFAHTRGVAHRDLKPSNIFLQAVPGVVDQVKILDFGLAKFIDPREGGHPGLTRAGAIFGTPGYMAPEQALGNPTSLASDVYSAGVLLFELFTGRRLFQGTIAEILQQHLHATAPSLRDARPDLEPSPALEAIVRRALASAPQNRYADGTELLAAFEAIPSPVARLASPALLSWSSDAVPEEPTVAPPVQSSGPPRRGVRAATLSVAAVVAIALGAIALPDRSASEAPAARAPAGRTAGASAVAPVVPASRSLPEGLAPPRPAAPSDDPWRAPVPEPLAAIRARVLAGERLSNADLRPVFGWAMRNPRDPRPWLLTGEAYANLGWTDASLQRYLQAYHLDPSVKNDPRMLADLSRMAADPRSGWRGPSALREVYGDTARVPAAGRETL